MKIALIACGGQLPVLVYHQLQEQNHQVTLIGFHEVSSELTPDFRVSLGQIGKIFKFLKQHQTENIILAGNLNRPNLWRLRFDYVGFKLALKIVCFFTKGDDALLRFIASYLDNHQLKLWSIADLCPKLVMPLGVITHHQGSADMMRAVNLGKKILNNLSEFDIGQSIAIAGDIVLGIEAIEGTDNLITRIGTLDKTRLNHLPKPILIKMRKKNQSNLLDLPTIGIQTIDNLHQSCFAGAAFEAEGCLVLDIQAVINRANQLGLCIIGFKND
jgi:UDP-2,3-diacylglucosamine hydrolase